MAESSSNENLPSTSRQPSQNLPSTSRQPSQNLPSTSRQSSHETIYLETYTWHAKYFHMIDKWRYKVPFYSNHQSHTVNVSYKAIIQDCLLQDISYYTCIEIVGEKNLLEATLKEHCDPKKIFTAKMYTNGLKEGTVMFFKRNGYPRFPIGNVNFFWKPGETDIKTIWIWVHPSFYSDFLSEIISSFEFKQSNVRQDGTDISNNLNDFYTNDTGCEMRVLKLNRFRLSGPAALTVLKEALRAPSPTQLDLDLENYPMTEERDSSFSDEKLDTSTDSNVSAQLVEKMVIDEKETNTKDKDSTIHDLKEEMWHTKYYKEKENIQAFTIQELMWQLMKLLGSPSFLLSNMIMGLTVLDPCSYLPLRRTRSEITVAENIHCQLPSNLNHSPIWDAQIRQIVSNSCVIIDTPDKFIAAASMSFNPSFNKDAVAKIPILFLQKPAVASLGLGSRIDVIIPSRWAMSFWMALIMRSPLVGGLRETKLIVFESLGTYVPDINDPDTPAYTREALTRKEELTNEYFSHSPDQRVNFIKFGIRNPFFCDWKNLTKGWSGVEDFYVLRHFRLLILLRTEIRIVKRKHARFKSLVQKSEFNFQEFDEYQNCLVQVKLSMMDKGTPKEFAIICMPTLEDLRSFENNENYDGPVEKCHPVPSEKSRKILRRVRTQLKRLSRHRVERKKTLQTGRRKDKILLQKLDAIHDEINRAKLLKRRQIISRRAKERRKLNLAKSEEVRHSCDREVMGYVTMGGYSFLREENIGIGFVTLPSLLDIILLKSNIVLVRNTKDLQYRLARLEILVDIKYAS